MKETLPWLVRPLMLDCYRDVVERMAPGLERANNSARDLAVLTAMSLDELLIGLPSLGKRLDLCLAAGIPFSQEDVLTIFPTHPDFLKGIIGRGEGSDTYRALRQICYLFSKLDTGNMDGVDEAVEGFITRNAEAARNYEVREGLLIRASQYVHSVLGGINLQDIRPKHGPGAVATKEKPWQKWAFKRIYAQLEELYPFTDYFFLNYTHLCDHLDSVLSAECLSHSVARMVAVPKDFRGPRLICAEPLEIQWIQQGQRGVIESAIETHPLTKGFVNFIDSNINKELARIASIEGYYSTLDLKDASDRVSVKLVESLFPRGVMRYLHASRSTMVDVLGVTQVPLNIMSPMGSAVCFPIESLVFFSISRAAIDLSNGRGLNSPLQRTDDVYVYGDDVIVKAEHALPVLQALSDLGITPNEGKCCIGTRFKESCGGDYYTGKDITPIRIKKLPRRQDPYTLPAATDYINNLRSAGLKRTAATFQVATEAAFGRLPWSHRKLPCVLRGNVVDVAYNNQSFASRWNKRFQVREYLISVTEPVFEQHAEPAWCEVFASIFSAGMSGARKKDRGYPLSQRGRLTKRWTAL